jgi:5-methylcytosine-specific restriction endonuclease McrA
MGNIPRNSAQRDRDRARIRATKAGCWICGQAVDYTLPHTDPMSFVVDHVIPLAKGGQDALANKKAAHRRQSRECNSKKRARIIAPIVKRSGALK